MANDNALRDHLLKYIDWDSAHLKFDDAVKDFPPALRGRRPQGSPHSAWELLEHLRLAQWDILEFTRDEPRLPKFPTATVPPVKLHLPPPPGRKCRSYRKDLRPRRAHAVRSSTLRPLPHATAEVLLKSPPPLTTRITSELVL